MTWCSYVVIVILISFYTLINNLDLKRSQCFVDVLVMADYKLYQKWYGWSKAPPNQKSDDAKENMKLYFSLVYDEVNRRYQSMNSTLFNITVQLNDIIIADSPTTEIAKLTSNHSRNNRVVASEVLEDLKKFALENEDSLPAHDHLTLFSGYSLLTDEGGQLDQMTKGVTFSQSVCQGASSVSVIQDSGGFTSITTVTHELGHSLGALHDGMNPCSADDQYVMAGIHGEETEANKYNLWFFSSCSVKEVDSYITIKNVEELGKGHMSCFQTAEEISQNVVDVTGQKPGQWFSPDEICQHIFGNESFLCRKTTKYTHERDVCLYMYCLDPASRMCFRNLAPEGTSCGNRKWCESGRCVFSKDAPVKVDGCVFGDEPFFTLRNLTCTQVVNKYPQACDLTDFLQLHCCRSCNICKSGDIWANCNPRSCHQIFPNGTVYDHYCCSTCEYNPESWNCSDTPGMDCSSLEPYHCYNSKTAFDCCSTCRRFRKKNVTVCEYEDRVPESECKTETQNGKLCSQQELSNKCCDFCTQRRECESGDIWANCDLSSCHQIFPNGTVYDHYCCRTCEHNPQSWNCSDTPGANCSSLDPYHCYNSKTAFDCCSTCSNFRKQNVTVSDCEYGDSVSQSDCDAVTAGGRFCWLPERSKICCDFCTRASASGDFLCLYLISVSIALQWCT